MRVIQKIFSGFILLFSFSSLPAQVDTVMFQRDSAVMTDMDLTTLFFQEEEKASNPSKLMLATKANKTINMSAFQTSLGIYTDHALADLDKDGKKELLVFNYTGGAHCAIRSIFLKTSLLTATSML